MSTTVSLEGARKAVFFPFQGKNWGTKLMIGAAVSLANYIVPFVPLIPVMGYAGQIAKHVILEDGDPELPEWKDWGLYFTDGIKLLGATWIYMLPSMVLIIGGYLLMFLLNFAAMTDPNAFQSPNDMAPFFLNSMAGAFAGMGLMIIGFFLAMLTSVFVPVALGHLIAKGKFSAAFHFREWWPIFKANFTGYLLMVSLLGGVSLILIWVSYIFYFTIILCFVMPVALALVTFLISVIHFSLIGVTYRDALQKMTPTSQA